MTVPPRSNERRSLERSSWRISVSETSERLRIFYYRGDWFILGLTVFLDLFFVRRLLGSAEMLGGPISGRFLLIMVMLVMNFSALSGLLNWTVIQIRRGRMTVRSGFLPMENLGTAGIRQFFCRKEGQHEPRTADDFMIQLFPRSRWDLWFPKIRYKVAAALSDGRQRKMVGDIRDQEEARSIRASLERYRGLQHHPVGGELI